ncbi:MAG: Re/Si-specific NAD(P)(+) transhydrogenase subunit alpha [Candidatus Eisenbacteria bacterium]|nr:Re/Si-specific NAD(P)(+) transhydrogenase subunit alpha [Candidatus Eisenbacteria bacterium]
MIVGVPKETFPGENRTALIPANIPTLGKYGIEVLIESGAGVAAGFPDDAYREKGARIAGERAEIFGKADAIAQVRAAGANPEAGGADLPLLRGGQALIAFLEPLADPEAAEKVAGTGVSLFSMEMIPRITRAQSMDALSSMANIAGYLAVLLGATTLPKFFPMFMTAAGTISAARVLVIGAGVAGLQAIATAKRLGAVVEAYDIRPAVKEQIQSLGARFVELPMEAGDAEDSGGYAKEQTEEQKRKQAELMADHVRASDVVITTAAVPGKRSPVLIPASVVEGMQPGSVIVDIAAEKGGNCELTVPGETVVRHGVTIVGPLNLPSRLAFHASQMYSKNMSTFLAHLTEEGSLSLDREDEIIRGSLVARGGKIVHPAVLQALGRS